MSAFSDVGMAQGINAGMQEATRGIIQGLDYKQRNEDRATQQASDAEATKQQLALYNQKFEQQELQLNDLRNDAAKKESYAGFSAYGETNDPKYLNGLLNNPTIKKALPGAIRYDNINPTEDKGLLSPLGLTKDMLDKDPTRYVKTTMDDGTQHITDMYGAYAMTGYTKVARQELLDKMHATYDTANTSVATTKANITNTALGSGDPETVMAALKLTDPALWLKVKQAGSVHMDSYTQSMTAFMAGNPNATPEQVQAFNSDWATKSIAGVGYNSQNKNVADLGGDRATGNKLFTPEGAKIPIGDWKVAARNAQDSALSNMDEKEKGNVIKAQETLQNNHNTATMVESLLKHDFKNVTTGVIDNAKTWLYANTGIENKQAINNVKFNTQTGMMLAGLIKEMSGTAAGDPEVARLLKNFLGGSFTDERYIKETMSAFSTYLRTKNNTLGKQYQDSIPYTVGTTTNLKPPSAKASANPSAKPSAKPALKLPPPPLIYPGDKPSKPSNKPSSGGAKPSLDSFWR